jgi:hypothetical protein
MMHSPEAHRLSVRRGAYGRLWQSHHQGDHPLCSHDVGGRGWEQTLSCWVVSQMGRW